MAIVRMNRVRERRKARRMPDGTTVHQWNVREVRLLALQALSGTSGAFRVSSILVAAASNGGRTLVGLQGRASASQGVGGRVFNSPLPATAGRSSAQSRENLAARRRERDECLSDYIGQWRFESVRSLAGDRQSGISLVIPFCRVTDAGGTTGRRSPHLRVSDRREGSCSSFAEREVAE